MKIQPKFAFVACLVLWAPHLPANAQKPNSKHHISDSQILPYIIDNSNSSNSVIRVRCFTNGRERRSFIRDRLLQTPDQENYITIEVEGSCSNVKIRLPNNSYTEYEPLHGDYWLYREGSGWNWLKSR
ncbi:hypothetical protein NIES4071_92460 [Calothrix sp. NIES-4071]|nr:hypothetical protein NIES4071_92460 [Calothrix sp. NIES-4071]BAZ63513.1 hypothetical protein NIES4105_92390 [Calothrix sp. NIES-4105]